MKVKPAELPGWPRVLTRELAAAYVGRSVATFDAEVKAGVWPPGKPIGLGRRKPRLGWDRLALDAKVDIWSGVRATPDGRIDDSEQERASMMAVIQEIRAEQEAEEAERRKLGMSPQKYRAFKKRREREERMRRMSETHDRIMGRKD